MSNLLIHLEPKQGYNNVFEVGQYDMKLTRFGIVQLQAGTSWSANTGEFEAALVLLGGKCSVSGKDFTFAEVGGRKNVFDGKPHTVYIPRRTEYTVTALTDMDFALNESPATRDTARPTVITPDMTILLDLDPEAGLGRVNVRGEELSRFEKLDFLKKVREAYLRLADILDYHVVDASQSAEKVAQDVLRIMEKKGLYAPQ